MNADYVRQVAAECDRTLERGEFHGDWARTLTRAAAVLHMLAAGPQEPLDGSESVPDTGETPTGQQGSAEPGFDPTPYRELKYDIAKRATLETAQQYDELAKAACAATGIVWPATHSGLLHALQGIADEQKAWYESWTLAEERAKTARNLQKSAEQAARDAEAHLDRLRNDLWRVLDLSPTTDDDLEATVLDRVNELDRYRKRWHEAATQRDALARAAKSLLDKDNGTNRSNLHSLTTNVLAGRLTHGTSADRLRRELWHVLDRMPAGDDDLIASVKKLVEVEKCGEALRGEHAP